jgi:hypothetical protein
VPSAAGVPSLDRQLTILGNQLNSLTWFAPGLQTLIAQVESLTASNPAIGPLLAHLQQAGWTPRIRSLVARVVLLDRLLEYLTHGNSLAARRFAPELPSLRILLTNLLHAANEHGVWQQLRADSMAAGLATQRPVLTGPQWVLAGSASMPQATETAGQPAGRAGSSGAHKPARTARIGAPSTSSSVTGPLPAPLPLVGSGGGATASGGLASSAPAAALLMMLAVWLMQTLLSGRLLLDLPPWRSTQVAWRPERPG